MIGAAALAQTSDAPLSLEVAQQRARFAREQMAAVEDKVKAAEKKDKAAQKRLEDAKAQTEQAAKQLQEAQQAVRKAVLKVKKLEKSSNSIENERIRQIQKINVLHDDSLQDIVDTMFNGIPFGYAQGTHNRGFAKSYCAKRIRTADDRGCEKGDCF